MWATYLYFETLVIDMFIMEKKNRLDTSICSTILGMYISPVITTGDRHQFFT